jgi:hypothetical protein
MHDILVIMFLSWLIAVLFLKIIFHLISHCWSVDSWIVNPHHRPIGLLVLQMLETKALWPEFFPYRSSTRIKNHGSTVFLKEKILYLTPLKSPFPVPYIATISTFIFNLTLRLFFHPSAVKWHAKTPSYPFWRMRKHHRTPFEGCGPHRSYISLASPPHL